MKTKDKMEIQDIWAGFYEKRDEHHRNLLMEHYENHVRYCAKMLHGKMSGDVDLDDLVSTGIFGLMDAIDAYDPDRGAKFETYCTPRIRGSMLDGLRSTDWVPRVVRARAHQLEQATQSFAVNLGRKPREEEIPAELNVEIEESQRIRRDANVSRLVSLDAQSSDDCGNRGVAEIDVISDKKSNDPLTEAQKRDLKHLLVEALSRTERLVIVLYYLEEMSLKQIGATLNLCESRVSQIRSSAISCLKTHIDRR